MAVNKNVREIKSRVAIRGAPVSVGGDTAGAEMGPSALRKAGLALMLEELGYEVTDAKG